MTAEITLYNLDEPMYLEVRRMTGQSGTAAISRVAFHVTDVVCAVYLDSSQLEGLRDKIDTLIDGDPNENIDDLFLENKDVDSSFYK